MKHKFKVGDRVEVTNYGCKGSKGVVIKIDETKFSKYKLKFENGSTYYKNEDFIKLIPTMKNIKDLGEKVAIQCKTQEEWDYIVKTYDISSVRSRPDLKVHLLDPNGGTYTLDYVKLNNYSIVQASDFMPLSPQDEIKELKERIATLEETLRPKKKIEFVKYLTNEGGFEVPSFKPNNFKEVELVYRYDDYDIMEAYDDESDDKFIYLGHFNDGEK